MNFLRLPAIILLCLFLTCCSEDDEPDSSADALLGTWSLTGLEYSGSSSTPGPSGVLTTNFTGEGYDMDLTVEFSANPNTFTTAGDYGIRLEVEILGQSNTLELPNQSFFNGGSWSREDDKLTLTLQDNVEQEATILELNESTMRMSVDVSGMVVSVGTIDEMEGTFIFTKQN